MRSVYVDNASFAGMTDPDPLYAIEDTAGVYIGLASLGVDDIYTRGNETAVNEVRWRELKEKGDNRFITVAVGSGGEVYVTGTTRGALPGQANVGDDDIFVRKYAR